MRKFCWCVELHVDSMIFYYAIGAEGYVKWDRDLHSSVRFADKESAEKIVASLARDDGRRYEVAEHEF